MRIINTRMLLSMAIYASVGLTAGTIAVIFATGASSTTSQLLDLGTQLFLIWLVIGYVYLASNKV